MRGSKVAVIMVVVVFLMCYGILTCHGREVSVACMMAYDQGGAPAVLNSLECPLWNFSIESSPIRRDNCPFAILQGWRNYQEDRVACNLAITIALLDNDGLMKSVNLSFAAIFDGHGGDEASELASRYFLDYFLLHVIFNNYKQAFTFHKDKEAAEYEITKTERTIYEILEEALLKTFKDVDLEFSQKALENGYISGSTGTVALLVDGQVLVGQVGDSKAILCSCKTNPHQGAKGIREREVHAHELTSDHHPDREDEKARITHAGGFVSLWDVPRVNGILAMSRAIGDVQLKRYGVIADPEISRRTLNGFDSYLIVGSDGLYERMTPTDICNLLKEDMRCGIEDGNLASCSSPSVLAKRIVDAAFESGSTDNLSALLISLEPYLS